MAIGDAFQVSAVMKLVDMVSGPLKNIRGEMASAGSGTASLSSRMKTLGEAMKPLAIGSGVVLSVLGSMALSTVGTGKALGELASVGVTDMKALESAATDFSNNWSGTTKAEFISAAYDIKSGVSSLTDEGVAEFTKLAALTGKATRSTTAEMTSLFATGYNIYKGMYEDLSDMEFGEVFSAGISASVKAFKTTGSDMAQAISTLGATAATAKVPLEEQLAVLGMLQGSMSGGEAGTKYRAFIQSAAKAGEALSLQFLDQNNQLLAMPEILDRMRAKYGDTLDAIEKMEIQKAFGSDEAVALIDLMYNRVGDVTENINGLQKAMQGGEGFTAKMAVTMNEDLGAVLQLARQRFGNLMETVGKVFVPVILLATRVVSRVTVSLQKMGETRLGQVLLGLAGVLAATVIGITGIAMALAGGGAAASFMATGLIPIKIALMAIGWPIGLLILAIGALYVAWQYNFGGIRDIANDVWQFLLGVYRDLITGFKMVGAEAVIFWHHLVDLKNYIVGLFDVNLYDAGVKLLATFTDGIKSAVMGPVEAVKGGLSKIRDMLPFSDAKEGPLSRLTASGMAIMGTIGEGVSLSAPDFARQFSSAIELPPVKMDKAKADKGKSVTIRIENLNLEKVNNAEDFITQLQGLVMAYDN